MRLNELISGLDPKCCDPVALELEISDIVYDSRKIVPGCLFVCLRGSAVDGHTFAQQAAQQGAAAILAEEALPVEIPVIVVPNTRQALAVVSAAYFGHPAEELQVIGATGTKRENHHFVYGAFDFGACRLPHRIDWNDWCYDWRSSYQNQQHNPGIL